MQYLDLIGAAFALAATICYVLESAVSWPLSIVATVLDITLYYKSGLYGDTGLTAFYCMSSIYGWYAWKHGAGQKPLQIRHIRPLEAAYLALLAIEAIVCLHYILAQYTNSTVPYWDAITTVLSLIAQWLICRKVLECWYLWFATDAIYVFLYYYKAIPAHSLLLIIYLGLAVAGWLRWSGFSWQNISRKLSVS